MPLYTYKNPKTGEYFEEIVPMSDSDNPFILDDGTKCPRIFFPPTNGGFTIIDKNREIFQIDSDYCKKINPKYIRFKDGHKEKYDPTKHC